ncbi:hypothetical protein L9F63_026352, partial [Diploptera punctata]
SYVKVCKKNDPDYDGCLANLVENLRPRLLKGIPKLNIPPLEPFTLPALDVTRDMEAIKVRAHITNIVAHGPGDFILNNLKTDVDNLVAEGTVTLPHLEVTAEYDVEGRALVAPFKGKGLFAGNFTNVKIDAKGMGKVVKKNGEDYMQITDLKAKIKVGDSKIKLDVKDDKQGALAQSAASFFNQNRKQLLDIIMPIVQDTAEEISIQLGNRILGSAPMSELLPA